MSTLTGKRGLIGANHRNPSRGYQFDDRVLEALNALQNAREPYKRGEAFKMLQRREGEAVQKPFTVVGFASTAAAHKDLVSFSRLIWHGDVGTGNMRIDNTTSGAQTLADALLTPNKKSNLYLVPHGEYKYLRMLSESFAKYWVDNGYQVEVSYRKGIYSGMTIRKGKTSWSFMDFKRHLGIGPEDIPEYVVYLDGGKRDHAAAIAFLFTTVKDFHALDKKHFNIAADRTAGQTGMQLHKRFFEAGSKMWKPCPSLVAYSRFGGGMSGGYQYYSAYTGRGFEVDQRKAYSKSMSQRIPKTWATGSPWTNGVLQEGMYLSRVTKSGGQPVRLGVYDHATRRFVPQLWASGECLAVICTVEHPGLQAMGCVIEPIHGWHVTSWFTMKPLIDHVTRVFAEIGQHSLYAKRVKVMINAIPGKLSSSPKQADVCISQTLPGEDWTLALTSEGKEIRNNWTRTKIVHTAYHNVAGSGWMMAGQRSDAYLFIAEMNALGKECVHFAVDGGLFKGAAPMSMPTETDEIGAFRLLHDNADITVSNHNQTLVNGVRKAAGVRQDVDPRLLLLMDDMEIKIQTQAVEKKKVPYTLWDILEEGTQTIPRQVYSVSTTE